MVTYSLETSFVNTSINIKCRRVIIMKVQYSYRKCCNDQVSLHTDLVVFKGNNTPQSRILKFIIIPFIPQVVVWSPFSGQSPVVSPEVLSSKFVSYTRKKFLKQETNYLLSILTPL